MSINNKIVGETISRLRLERGMTQQQLSSVIGVSHQAVSKWENGAALPDLDALLKLSRLFGVSVEELTKGAETEEASNPFSSIFDENVVDGIKEAAQSAAQTAKDIGNSIYSRLSSFVSSAADAIKGQASREPEDEDYEAADEEYAPEHEESGSALPISELIELAPFMSREKLSQLVCELEQPLSLGEIKALAPFVTQETLGQLLNDGCEEDVGIDELISFAPFLKKEPLFKLVMARQDQLDLSRVKALAPFLKKGMVDILVDGLNGIKRPTSDEVFRQFTDNIQKGAQSVYEKVKSAVKQAQQAAKAANADSDTAAEDALNARNWAWLSLNADSVASSELQLKICLTAARELSDNDEIVGILLKAVPSMDEVSTAALINELAQAGKWDLCEELINFADTSAADGLLRLATGKPEARNAALLYSSKASKEALAAFLQGELNN
ncbi:MAG: helix-turn-helix domain-containing protein [Clostridiales bacterium]|nr:helix-turn-helix domain-containing protein [Clostridiales bacterium]